MSSVFNTSFYLSNNADVVLAIAQGTFSSAQQHFDLFGGRELRNPNATFDSNYYSVQNPDVLSAVSAGVFPIRLPTFSLLVFQRIELLQRPLLVLMRRHIWRQIQMLPMLLLLVRLALH